MLVAEKIMEDYVDNCTLRPMTEYEKGYHQAMIDIMMKNPEKRIEI